MAPVASVMSHTLPALDVASSVSFDSSNAAAGIVSLSVSMHGPVEPFSVPPLQYSLSRAESASLCSADSMSSRHSSTSSVHSPVSPLQRPQPTAHSHKLPPASAYPAAVPLHIPYTSTSESPSSAATFSSTLPPDDATDQPVSSLRLPSFIYPTVQSAISAALHSITSTSTTTKSSSQPALDKRKGELFDTERRLKHRLIDANRRRRESVLVERFAQLSGQRDETLSLDRVSTLEVACDRYEELTRVVEAMKDKMRRMEERLQACDGAAAGGEPDSSKRKSRECRRAARARSGAQHSPLKRRPKPSSVSAHKPALGNKCEVTLSDSDSS